MATPDTRLKDIAHDLLDTIGTILTDNGLSVPDRRYVHQGQIVVDFAGQKCTDQLIVSFGGLLQGGPNTDLETAGASIPGSAIIAAVPLVALYNIGLFRCVPTVKQGGKAPTIVEIGASGDDVMTEALTIANGIIEHGLDQTLVPSLPACGLYGMGSVEPYGPSGGAGGCIIQLFVSLV